MAKPDYSHYLSLPGNLDHEEAVWAEASHERAQADLIATTAELHGLQSVVEFGCATGWMPHYLGERLQYLGIDANPDCLARARAKNPHRLFIQGDVRTVIAPYADLAVAFALLKHFHLSEWDGVLFRILHYGRYGLFSMPIAPRSYEDDCEYPHVWVSPQRLQRAVEAAGHEIISTPWGEEMDREWMIVTRRRS